MAEKLMIDTQNFRCEMAITETFAQEHMDEASIADAMALIAEACWNQVPQDWNVMHQIGDAIVLRDANNNISASALCLPYSGGFGWISMVLVARTMRRKGLATRLLADRIAWLKDRNLVPMLDATEEGAQVYQKIGFQAGKRLTRWQGVGQKIVLNEGATRPATADELEWICRLDAETFGADRSFLIRDLLARPESRCIVSAVGNNGFIIARAGRSATHFGPLVAKTERMAGTLLDAALDKTPGPVLFDMFDTRNALADHAIKRGFLSQRAFVRMSLGPMRDFDGDGKAMFIAGPEYG